MVRIDPEGSLRPLHEVPQHLRFAAATIAVAESDQPEAARSRNRFLTRGNLELAVKALVVGLDGVDRQKQCRTNLTLARCSLERPQNRQLAVRQIFRQRAS